MCSITPEWHATSDRRGLSIGALFAAGLSVALAMSLLFSILTFVMVLKYKIPVASWAGMATTLRAARRAIVPLGMPIIVVVGILSGFFTASEAASVAVAYGLVFTVLVYRTIGLRDLIQILRQTAITSAAINILVGAAAMFFYVIVRRNVPREVIDFLLPITSNAYGIVAIILVLLLLAGIFLDWNSTS